MSKPGSSDCARASPRTIIPAPVSSMTLIATCAPSRTVRNRIRDPPDSPFSAAAVLPRVQCSAGASPKARHAIAATPAV